MRHYFLSVLFYLLSLIFYFLYKINSLFLFKAICLPDAYIKGIGYSAFITDEYVKRGLHSKAIEVLRKNIAVYLDQKFEWKNAAEPQKQTSNNNTAAQLACLKDFMSAFSETQIKPFLAYGTLLGMVREAKFIKNDRDIDFGLFWPDTSCKEVIEILTKAGFLLEQNTNPKWPGHLRFLHPNKMYVDVVFFKKTENKLITHLIYLNNIIVRERASFNLVRADFLGEQVWIPENPEIFLNENYGEWRMPSKFYHYILSCNLTNFNSPVIEYLSHRFFYRSLIKGNLNHSLHVLNFLVDKYPADLFWKNIRLKMQNIETE